MSALPDDELQGRGLALQPTEYIVVTASAAAPGTHILRALFAAPAPAHAPPADIALIHYEHSLDRPETMVDSIVALDTPLARAMDPAEMRRAWAVAEAHIHAASGRTAEPRRIIVWLHQHRDDAWVAFFREHASAMAYTPRTFVEWRSPERVYADRTAGYEPVSAERCLPPHPSFHPSHTFLPQPAVLPPENPPRVYTGGSQAPRRRTRGFWES